MTNFSKLKFKQIGSGLSPHDIYWLFDNLTARYCIGISDFDNTVKIFDFSHSGSGFGLHFSSRFHIEYIDFLYAALKGIY